MVKLGPEDIETTQSVPSRSSWSTEETNRNNFIQTSTVVQHYLLPDTPSLLGFQDITQLPWLSPYLFAFLLSLVCCFWFLQILNFEGNNFPSTLTPLGISSSLMALNTTSVLMTPKLVFPVLISPLTFKPIWPAAPSTCQL